MNKILPIALGAGVVLLLLSKKTKAKANEAMELVLYDQYGNKISDSKGSKISGRIAAFATSAVEASTINAVCTVKNTSRSVRLGVATAIPAVITLQFTVDIGYPALLVEGSTSLSFAANETKTLTSATWPKLSFVLPNGSGGKTGTAVLMGWAGATAPGVAIGQVQAIFSITAAPVEYVWGADLAF